MGGDRGNGFMNTISRRSRVVSLGLVPAVAAWFASCGSQQPGGPPPTHQKLCIDQVERVVDDQYCVDKVDSDSRPRTTGSGGGVPYHWYYMPYRAGGYPIGFDAGHAASGSVTAPGSGARVAAGRVVTGGFGSTATGSMGS